MVEKHGKANIKKGQKRKAWNKGKAVGQKAPFPPEAVRLIRSILKRDNRLRDLALLNTAIDSMLRASDLLELKVDDVMDHQGRVQTDCITRQDKTHDGVVFTLGSEARSSLQDWIEHRGKDRDSYLFTSMRLSPRVEPISRTQYSRLIKEWASLAGLDPRKFSTHSGRRTKTTVVYNKTQNIAIVKELLGHKSTSSTAAYLGIDKQAALKVAKDIDV